MKKPPIVTIVGRQNVGKSTLYNRLAGRKGHSITKDIPGVTRDVLEVSVEREELNGPILLRDTPGLDIENLDEMSRSILEVSFAHLKESDLILHVIDKKDVREYDFTLLEYFRKDKDLSKIPILFIANKVDTDNDEIDMEELYRLGITEPVPVSALGKRNLGLVFEKINFMMPHWGKGEALQPDIRLSIVGKPNSGKSSLLNAILGYQRAVVSEVAGTTRDSLNAYIQYKGKLAEVTDTAGIRKKSRTAEALEFYSYKRTLKAMAQSDVVVFLLDATKGVGEYDKKIFAYLEKSGKPVVIGFNKWDLIPDKTDKTLNEYRDMVIGRFPAMKNKPMLTLSALTRQRVSQLLDRAWQISDKAALRITTGELNRKIKEWMSDGKVVRAAKRIPKVKYATQISASPFHVVFFVNNRDLFTPNILSFFKKKFEQDYGLSGIPVKIDVRDNDSEKGDRKSRSGKSTRESRAGSSRTETNNHLDSTFGDDVIAENIEYWDDSKHSNRSKKTEGTYDKNPLQGRQVSSLQKSGLSKSGSKTMGSKGIEFKKPGTRKQVTHKTGTQKTVAKKTDFRKTGVHKSGVRKKK